MIQEIKGHIKQFFKDSKMTFHSHEHTIAVHEHAILIAREEEISEEEIELLEIAALFHDTGYSENPGDHEAISFGHAERFLQQKGYDGQKIEAVKNLILATKFGTEPNNKLESIIKDADLYNLGSVNFLSISKSLKREREHLSGINIDKKDWLAQSIEFLENHKWYTQTGKKLMNKVKKTNLKQQKLDYKEQLKLDERIKPVRGVETMYKVALRNHNSLSVIADNKANILLSLTGIMLSLILSSMATKVDTNPNLLIPTVLIVLVSLATMTFSILAIRPKLIKFNYSRERLLNNKIDILFFGNFTALSIEEFEWGLKELSENRDLLYGSLTKDLYYLGVVLKKKYRLLRIAYGVFMYGFGFAALTFVVALVYPQLFA